MTLECMAAQVMSWDFEGLVSLGSATGVSVVDDFYRSWEKR